MTLSRSDQAGWWASLRRYRRSTGRAGGRWSWVLALAITLPFAVPVPAAPAAPAAPTFTVTTSFDVPADPADTNYSVCRTAANNTICTLRAAIMKANHFSGGGVHILIPSGIYTLTEAPTGGDGEPNGDLNILQTMTLAGAGAEGTIIDGGGLDRVFSVITGTTVSLQNITIRRGHTTGNGGGLLSFGSLTIDSSIVISNTSQHLGGGIASNSHLTLTNSRVIGNQSPSGSGSGGGLYLAGTASISNSLISDNEAGEAGGGLFLNAGTYTISNSSISGNRGGTAAAGIYSHGTTTINNSTINANMTPAFAGGVWNDGGTLTLNNSTLSANSAVGKGGALVNDTTAHLFFVTIAGNVADNQAIGSQPGGGIFNLGGATTDLWNSLLAENYETSTPNDCAPLVTSHDYNYIQTTSGCLITGTTDNTLVGGEAGLAGLGVFGGPTLTRPLLAGSPALDQIPTGLCRDSLGATPIPDQRGVARPVNGLCDMGAYEGLYTPPLYMHNLLRNGDAESGGGSPAGTQVGVPSWTVTAGSFTTVPYGAPGGFPDPATDFVPRVHGYNFFAGGPQALSTATQVITVTSLAAPIDGSKVKYDISSNLGGYAAQDDNATFVVTFLNGSSTPIGSPVTQGPILAADRNNQTGFDGLGETGTVPAGTRYLRATITMVAVIGYNSALADNLSVILLPKVRNFLPLVWR
jgi:hypothetical protein